MTKPDGFVLAEAIALMVVALLLGVLALVCGGEARRHSSLGDNFANLRQFAGAAAAYGADNDDLVFGYSWRAGTDYGFGGPASTDLRAAANQAWHILRTRTGMPEFFGSTPPSNWVPHILYSHLPLLDYLEVRLPERFAIAPEDRLRLLWASDPVGFASLPSDQRPPGSGTAARRWPFSSSYELPPAFYSPDAGSTISQVNGSSHNFYQVPPVPLGGRRIAEVALPSQKVLLFEQYQRHFGPRTLYFAYDEARVPLLLADGSAAVRRTGDANRGFYPPTPTSLAFTRVIYSPGAWEPPTASGASTEYVTLHYRFTRSGLRGRDFGGPEVPWAD